MHKSNGCPELVFKPVTNTGRILHKKADPAVQLAAQSSIHSIKLKKKHSCSINSIPRKEAVLHYDDGHLQLLTSANQCVGLEHRGNMKSDFLASVTAQAQYLNNNKKKIKKLGEKNYVIF